MNKPAYIITSNTINISFDDKDFVMAKSNDKFEQVVEAIAAEDWPLLFNLMQPARMIQEQLSSKSTLEQQLSDMTLSGQYDEIVYNGTVVNSAMVDVMLEMLALRIDISHMVAFLDNLAVNPSKRAVDELYGFIEACNLPITADGHFLAYKKIRNNYTDCHTGTMDNSIGATVEMPRNQVDDQKDSTCSMGLHFCSRQYLNHFSGARLVVVKINPADVVSIPTDYNNSKGRACKYVILKEIEDADDMPSYFDRDSIEEDYQEIEDYDVAEATEYLITMKLDDDSVNTGLQPGYVTFESNPTVEVVTPPTPQPTPQPGTRLIRRTDIKGNTIEYSSIERASTINDIPVSYIARVLSGDRHTTGGYEWDYVYSA